MSILNKYLILSVMIISQVFIIPNILNADSYKIQYSSVKNNNYVWLYPIPVTPITSGPTAFTMAGVASDPTGGGADRFIAFFAGGVFDPDNPIPLGGFSANVLGTTVLEFMPFSGPVDPVSGLIQLYSVNPITKAISFNLGTYTGTELLLGNDAKVVISLVIDNVPVPVPEPATYASLAGFLALGAIAVAKRARRTEI